MSCCNHDCNQGRNCPERKKYDVPSYASYTIILVVLTAIILLTWK